MTRRRLELPWIERFAGFLRRENLHRILLSLVFLSLLSAIALAVLEPHLQFTDWLWWSIVTLTTVGYGDITPSTMGGRIIGIVLMFLGIGVLSTFTATIASLFVERKLKRERGMGTYKLTDHIILCEWNRRAREILRELRSDPRTANKAIVLLADIETKPVDDENLFFIRGEVSEERLEQACLPTADTVIILGDDRLEGNARDAKAVLSTLAVEDINPAAYTIVELLRQENVRHCQRAHADEIIVGDEFSSRLIASAAVDHGISKVLSELLSATYGSELRRVPVPTELAGQTFFQALQEMKRDRQCIVLAIQRGQEVLTNPAMEEVVAVEDRLIVITTERGA